MKKLFMMLGLVLIIASLAACGGNTDGAATGETNEQQGSHDNHNATDSADNTVVITASNYKFDKNEYHAKAGEITIELVNEQGMHGIEIEGTDFNLKGDGTATITLEPGEYTIKCSIYCGTGHTDMHSTLIVK